MTVEDGAATGSGATLALAERAGRALADRGLRVAVAESCTGGGLAQALTAPPGSSEWFDCGFVTYSNEAKSGLLGVSEATVARAGAVSEHTVREMAEGALARSRAQLCVALSGVAGPGGGTASKPVGMVCMAIAVREPAACHVSTHQFGGGRSHVRVAAVNAALTALTALLERG